MFEPAFRLARILYRTGAARAATAIAAIAFGTTLMGTPPAEGQRRPATWGAIAYNATNGAYGVGYNFARKTDAQSMALKKCPNVLCRTIVTFRGGCAAVSAERLMKEEFGTNRRRLVYTGTFGYGYAPTRAGAVARAEAQCRKRAAGFCHVRVWVCTRS